MRIKGEHNKFEGQPCKVCGETLRYVSFPNSCVACTKRHNANKDIGIRLTRIVARIVRRGESW